MVWKGSSTGPSKAPAWTVQGSQPGEGFGQAVGQAGDLDGDGKGDLLVAGPGHKGHGGVAAFFRGGRGLLEGSPTWRRVEAIGGSQYGFQAAQAGDCNGDGRPEWFVCSPSYGGKREMPGKVFHYQVAGKPALGQQRLRSGSRWLFKGAAISAKAKVSGRAHWRYEFKPAGAAFDGKALLKADSKGRLDLSGLSKGAWRWRARKGPGAPWMRSAEGRLGGCVDFRIVPEN